MVRRSTGEGSSNPSLADGTGLDHLAALVGGQVFMLATAAQAAVPAGS